MGRRSPGSALRGGPAWTDTPALALFALHYLGQPPAGIDDAWIFYRYAANWAAGFGPAFNPGERVEGFSSVLWTAILAGLGTLGVSPEVAGPVLGFLFGAGTLLLLGDLARRHFPGEPALHVLLPMALALSSGFTRYAASGMDTSLFAFVLLGGLAATDRALGEAPLLGEMAPVPAGPRPSSAPLLAIALGALVVVRAEGAAYALILVAGLALGARRDASIGHAARVGALVVIVVILAQAAARMAYFGAWIPASMSSKAVAAHELGEWAAGSATARRELVANLLRGVRYEFFVLPLLLLPALALLAGHGRGAILPRVMAAIIALNVVVTIWAAGDWMPQHRHLVPVWPLVLMGAAWAAAHLAAGLASRPLAALACGAAILAVLLVAARGFERSFVLASPLDPPVFREEAYGRRLRDVGAAVGRQTVPAVLVTNMAGTVGYQAGARTLVRDVLGLTDRHNALHGAVWSPTYGRTDPAYTFGNPLDVLVSNTAKDLVWLDRYACPPGGTRREFTLLSSPEWLEDRFFVAVRSGTPLERELRSLGRCGSTPLDSATAALVRDAELAAHGWRLEGLGVRMNANIAARTRSGRPAPRAD